jgi:hypothetical protein
MVESAKDRIRDNVAEPLDGPSAGRILTEQNVGPNLIVIGRVFRKDSPKVLGVEHQQMVRALAPDRADQAFNISVIRYVGGGASHVLLIFVDWRMVRPSGTWGTGST